MVLSIISHGHCERLGHYKNFSMSLVHLLFVLVECSASAYPWSFSYERSNIKVLLGHDTSVIVRPESEHYYQPLMIFANNKVFVPDSDAVLDLSTLQRRVESLHDFKLLLSKPASADASVTDMSSGLSAVDAILKKIDVFSIVRQVVSSARLSMAELRIGETEVCRVRDESNHLGIELTKRVSDKWRVDSVFCGPGYTWKTNFEDAAIESSDRQLSCASFAGIGSSPPINIHQLCKTIPDYAKYSGISSETYIPRTFTDKLTVGCSSLLPPRKLTQHELDKQPMISTWSPEMPRPQTSLFTLCKGDTGVPLWMSYINLGDGSTRRASTESPVARLNVVSAISGPVRDKDCLLLGENSALTMSKGERFAMLEDLSGQTTYPRGSRGKGGWQIQQANCAGRHFEVAQGTDFRGSCSALMLKGEALKELEEWLGEFCALKGVHLRPVTASTTPKDPGSEDPSATLSCTTEMDGFSTRVDLFGNQLQIKLPDDRAELEMLGDYYIQTCYDIELFAHMQLMQYHSIQKLLLF